MGDRKKCTQVELHVKIDELIFELDSEARRQVLLNLNLDRNQKPGKSDKVSYIRCQEIIKNVI